MGNAPKLVQLSSAAFVVLHRSGLAVWSGDDPAPLELQIDDLVALQSLTSPRGADEVLDAAAPIGSAERGRLEVFLKELQARGFLREADTPAPLKPSAPVTATDGLTGDPPAAPDTQLQARSPLVLRPAPRGFEYLDHDGRTVLRLTAGELAALTCFPVGGATLDVAHGHLVERVGPGALSRPELGRLASTLSASGLLFRAEANASASRADHEARRTYATTLRMRKATKDAVAAHDTAERVREERTGSRRVRVMPMDTRGAPNPLALGMVMAYARAHRDGLLQQHFQFVPSWFTPRNAPLSFAEEPGIYLFSDYIWSHGQNLDLAERVKSSSPHSLTIHGGPDAPKYEKNVEDYLRINRQVDVLVHGEGEVTFAAVLEALTGAFNGGAPDLSCLHDVAGISFRDGDRVVHTPPRDRIVDLDTLPSPYLTGEFDVHAKAGFFLASIETNRGCPYGCTFCDWGSATTSRIRKFDLDRVYAELEWCARNEVARIFVADANFGILDRDVEIAEKVAALKEEHGYPKLFSTNYAKNGKKHLSHIVRTFAKAGILTHGLLSLQTMDAETLKTVKRSNIKVEKYEELAREFRQAGLPLFIDLMLGLPGSTIDSFRSDLQGCVDREVTAKMYQTELLINSPMNEPSYRESHRIETSAPLGALVKTSRRADGSTKPALLVSTSTYTRADYEAMLDLRRTFLVAENFGVLRQISRFVRQEAGVYEVELYERLRRAARTEPDRWPALNFLFRTTPFIGIAPASWQLMIDEVHRYVVDELGVADDEALQTVLTVQHALLPTPGRSFPLTLSLPHDYAAWHRALVDAKDDGRFDWETVLPPLRDFPPGHFSVDDPHDVCTRGVGSELDQNTRAVWELASPVARAVAHEHEWDG